MTDSSLKETNLQTLDKEMKKRHSGGIKQYLAFNSIVKDNCGEDFTVFSISVNYLSEKPNELHKTMKINEELAFREYVKVSRCFVKM